MARQIPGDTGSAMNTPTRSVTPLNPHDLSPGVQGPPALGGSRAKPWSGRGQIPPRINQKARRYDLSASIRSENRRVPADGLDLLAIARDPGPSGTVIINAIRAVTPAAGNRPIGCEFARDSRAM